MEENIYDFFQGISQIPMENSGIIRVNKRGSAGKAEINKTRG